MANWQITQTIDLKRPAPQIEARPESLMLCGDNKAHTWRIEVRDGGSPAALTGATVVGYFVRRDGDTVAVPGTVEGSAAVVTLAQACYAVEGRLDGVVRLTTGGATITLAHRIFSVGNPLTNTVVNPGA